MNCKRIFSLLLALIVLAGCLCTFAAAEEAPKKGTGITGTFMQPWLYNGYSDKKMDREFARMKELGIDTVIMGDTFGKPKGFDSAWELSYPGTLPEFKGSVCRKDAVDTLFRFCKKYGMKLYLGLGNDSDWWDLNMAEDSSGEWLKSRCEISAKAVKDIYDLYVPKYGDTFGGYYWVYEIWNHGAWNTDFSREKFAKHISDGFNIIIDAINEVDPTKPILFSPFTSYVAPGKKGLATKENCYKFYDQLFRDTNFRKIDAILPMDNIGGGGMTLEHLDEWTKDVYYKAVKNNQGKLQLWANCESFVQPQVLKSDWTTCTMDRFTKQIEIASKYCSKIVSFSWNHYMSPQNTIDGFDKSFQYYLDNGRLETEKPTVPTKVNTSVANGYLVAKWTQSEDNMGVAYYIVEKLNPTTKEFNPFSKCLVGRRDGKPVSLELKHSLADAGYNKSGETTYRVHAVDCSGNNSDNIYIVVDGKNPDNGVDLNREGGEKGYYTEAEFKALSGGQEAAGEEGAIDPLVLGICIFVMVLACSAVAVTVVALKLKKKSK